MHPVGERIEGVHLLLLRRVGRQEGVGGVEGGRGGGRVDGRKRVEGVGGGLAILQLDLLHLTAVAPREVSHRHGVGCIRTILDWGEERGGRGGGGRRSAGGHAVAHA